MNQKNRPINARTAATKNAAKIETNLRSEKR